MRLVLISTPQFAVCLRRTAYVPAESVCENKPISPRYNIIFEDSTGTCLFVLHLIASEKAIRVPSSSMETIREDSTRVLAHATSAQSGMSNPEILLQYV